MKAKLKISIYFLLTIVFSLLTIDYSHAAQQEQFIYDSMGKRDPFIPLLDKGSPTGLRINFMPPELEIRLPLTVEIEGILWNGREYFAIINHEVVKKGDKLGKVKIKNIEQDKVILEYSERDFTVFLK